MAEAYSSSGEVLAFRDLGDIESGFSSHASINAAMADNAKPRNIASVPRISIGAFCESQNVIAMVEAIARDRLMARTSLEIYAGGVSAALQFCQSNPVPNLLLIESRQDNDTILRHLDALAEVCDENTRVLLIGYTNDIGFYRELMIKGISEYVVAPFEPTKLIESISRIYRDDTSKKLGQIFAFMGAKGGVGSSTIAHNIGSMIGRQCKSNVLLADMDLAFGTAGLNLNVDASQGILDAIQGSSRLDDVLLERLMVKCDSHMNLLASPAAVTSTWDHEEGAYDTLIELAQSNLPYTVLDLPHSWAAWTRRALIAADQIVVTLTPDLASIRNTKNLVQVLRQSRPNDPPPKIVLNQVGVQKRPEIKPSEIAKALETEISAVIGFDAQLFGSAANNGKMIGEIAAKSAAAQAFSKLAAELVGRNVLPKEKPRILSRVLRRQLSK